MSTSQCGSIAYHALVLVGLFGCGAREAPPPKSVAATEPPPPESATTTSADVPGPSSKADVRVSDRLARECDIHFNETNETPKFDFDRSAVRPEDGAVLAQVARCVTVGRLKGRRLRLVGHADPRGESEYNFALGENRAESVRTYLNALGVDPIFVTATSRGKLDAVGTDEATWQTDRRVDLDLL